MYSFGKESKKLLQTCDDKLIEIANEAIKIMNFSVIEGHRSNKLQEKYYKKGLTKLMPGKSKHNKYPSLAFHLLPYPFDGNWKSQVLKEELSHLAGIVIAIGHMKGIKVRWGGDWDQDRELDDQKFDDLMHFEID